MTTSDAAQVTVAAGATPRERIPDRWQVIALAGCLLVAFAYAFTRVQSWFAWYDDEGFMLFTLRQWLSGTSLYDAGYTEYGPFYYLAYSTWFWLSGWSPTHDAMRWITVLLWVAVPLGCAACVWAFSRSFAWTALTILATTVVLRDLSGEPGHPQGLVWALLTAVPALMLTYRRIHTGVLFGTLGAIVAMVTLVKVNVGVFLLLSLLAVLGPGLLPLQLRGAGRWIGTAIGAAMPALLMGQHLTNRLILWQCALAAFGIGAVTYTILRKSESPPGRAVGWLAAGMVVTAGLLVGMALLHGESAYGLLNGVLLQPLRFSRAIQPQTPDAATLIAATAFAAVSGLLLVRMPAWGNSDRARLVRKALATLTALVAVINPRLAAIAGPVILWLVVPNGRHATVPARLAARTVVTLATYASLVAFPVAGTQSNLAATLILWAAIIGILDDVGESRRWRVLPLCLLASGVALPIVLDGLVYALVERVPSRLPGSQLIELVPERAATFNELVRLAGERCQTLTTLPGMNSFNIWTDLPRPNGFTTSAAMVLFDGPSQRRLTRDFLASPRPCVIDNPALERWSSMFRKPSTDRPFVDLVRRDLVRVYSRSGYDILVPQKDVSRWSDPTATRR